MKRHVQIFARSTALALVLLWSLPAAAQVEYLSPAQQKKEVRKALKEAKNVKSDYSESHLNLQAYSFKKGESGRKRVKNPQEQDEMLMNEDGTAVTKPKAKAKTKRTRKR